MSPLNPIRAQDELNLQYVPWAPEAVSPPAMLAMGLVIGLVPAAYFLWRAFV